MFPPKLDAAFKINVAKMRVQLPAQLREQIEEAIRPVIKAAQERYRKTSRKHGPSGEYGASAQASRDYGAEQPRGKYETAKAVEGRTWTLEDIERVLMQSANGEERRVIARVIERVRLKLATAEVE
jgi:hypothetical protein